MKNARSGADSYHFLESKDHTMVNSDLCILVQALAMEAKIVAIYLSIYLSIYTINSTIDVTKMSHQNPLPKAVPKIPIEYLYHRISTNYLTRRTRLSDCSIYKNSSENSNCALMSQNIYQSTHRKKTSECL